MASYEDEVCSDIKFNTILDDIDGKHHRGAFNTLRKYAFLWSIC